MVQFGWMPRQFFAVSQSRSLDREPPSVQSAGASMQYAAPRVQLGLGEELVVQLGCMFVCSARRWSCSPLNFYLFPAFTVS